MTAGPMRGTLPTTLLGARGSSIRAPTHANLSLLPIILQRRCLARLPQQHGVESGKWFSGSRPSSLPDQQSGPDGKPPDERTLKLGKTIRILHERLPTLLASPLPQEIISPQITLHLFPSTHPHLPTVSGRIAYMAALWTAPVAWGRVPVVGNVKLEILSERMVRNGGFSTASNMRHEKLIVKWKTCGKTKGKGVGALYRGISGGGEQVDKITEFLGGDATARDDEEFVGLFVFEFDDEGRIVTHTIEHAEEGGNWDRMTKVISVTDWLLGKAWGKKEPSGFALGYCRHDDMDPRRPRRRSDSR